MLKSFAIAVAVLVFAHAGFAEAESMGQGTLLGLTESLEKALKDSSRVKQAEARLEKEKALLSAVKRSFFPKLSTEIYTAFATGDSRGIIFWTSEIRLPVFDGGKLIHERRKKDLEVREKELCLEETKRDVAYEVKVIYIGLVKERELTRLAQECEKEARRFYRAMKALSEKELLARRELFRWETLFRSAQHELIKHKEAMDYGETLISGLVGIERNERIELEPICDIGFQDKGYRILPDEMERKNPLYELVKLRIKEKEEEKKVLSSERFPKLGLAARYNVAKDSFVDHARFEGGLVGSWNIWDFGVLGSEIKAKEAEIKEMIEEGKIKTRELENEAMKLTGDLKVARSKISSLKTLLKERKEAYSNEKTKFIVGENGELDVFNSLVGLVQAKMSLIEAFADYRLIRARIERILIDKAA